MNGNCLDCDLPYEQFTLDVVLPRSQWLLIHPDEHGVLCAACIVKRAATVPGCSVVHAILELRSRASLGRCESCEHLRKFDATKEYFNCPVVNIRVHAQQVSEFGCTLWEAKASRETPGETETP